MDAVDVAFFLFYDGMMVFACKFVAGFDCVCCPIGPVETVFKNRNSVWMFYDPFKYNLKFCNVLYFNVTQLQIFTLRSVPSSFMLSIVQRFASVQYNRSFGKSMANPFGQLMSLLTNEMSTVPSIKDFPISGWLPQSVQYIALKQPTIAKPNLT